MNLGLGNLIELKRFLLAPDLASEATWDAVVTALGQGVARLLESYCSRRFERTVGAADVFSAARMSWILQRYPVESIASIDQKDSASDGFVSLGAVNSVIQNWDAQSGRVDFGAIMGAHSGWVKITYTGGFWFDTTETDPPSVVPPGGATLLAEDIKLAWFLQCKKVFEVMDPLGTGIIKGGSNVQLVGLSLIGLELIPQVKQLLAPHVRFQIT
jgi:hypothetical protein